MARVLAGLLTLVVLAGPAAVRAQTRVDLLPGSGPPPAGTSAALGLALGSLDAAPPLPPATQPRQDLPGPYFVPDPMLDLPQLPPLGWFAEVDTALLLMHVERQSFLASPPPLVTAGAKAGAGGFPLGYVPQAHLDGTVSPRFQVGYRLPSGFGEFALSYRFLATTGEQTFVNNNGPSSLRGRLDLNVADLTYASHEISLWSCADMRWHVGGRFSNVFFDDHLSTPQALAAAGDGVSDQRFSNHFYGFGPVFGLQLTGHVEEASALTWLVRIEGAWVFGRIGQSYSQVGPLPGPGFKAPFSSSQDAPTLNVQAGLRWRARPGLDLFAGYQFEYWWEVGRLGNIDSRGEFYDQGIIARASLCW